MGASLRAIDTIRLHKQVIECQQIIDTIPISNTFFAQAATFRDAVAQWVRGLSAATATGRCLERIRSELDRCAENIEIIDIKRLESLLRRVLTGPEAPGLLSLAPEPPRRGWIRHPAVRMYAQHVDFLRHYKNAALDELGQRKTVKSNRPFRLKSEIYRRLPVDSAALVYPLFWGDERLHSTMRANLLRKMEESRNPYVREFYSGLGWTETPILGYHWCINGKWQFADNASKRRNAGQHKRSRPEDIS